MLLYIPLSFLNVFYVLIFVTCHSAALISKQNGKGCLRQIGYYKWAHCPSIHCANNINKKIQGCQCWVFKPRSGFFMYHLGFWVFIMKKCLNLGFNLYLVYFNYIYDIFAFKQLTQHMCIMLISIINVFLTRRKSF